jgi:hypothetical protein
MLLLSFLGEQPLPTLLPLWNDSTFSATCLMPSEKTEGLGKVVTAFIQSDPDLSHIQVFPYFKVSAYDLDKTKQTLKKQIGLLQNTCTEPICINLTGGTKLMSMAGMMAAYEMGYQMLYVATENNEILHLTPGIPKPEVTPLNVKISIDQYFSAYGIETSLDQSFANPDEHTFHPPKEGDELEEYVYQQAIESGYFDDVKKGLFIRKATNLEQPLLHELDVVVIKNGRLAVCSCKSGKYSPKFLAELEALTAREKFGIYCGKAFASQESLTNYRIKEFHQNRVTLISGDRLPHIADYLLLSMER